VKYFDRQVFISNKFYKVAGFHIFNKAFRSSSRYDLCLVFHILEVLAFKERFLVIAFISLDALILFLWINSFLISCLIQSFI
jgi:hypothetical protein